MQGHFSLRHNIHLGQEMWANAHETCDSISLILNAGCLGLSPVISAKIHFLSVHWSLKSQKNSLKTRISGVLGRSRSSMFVPPETSSAVLVMVCSMFVSIWNHSLARLVDSIIDRVYWKGYPKNYPYWMHLYRGLLEPRRSKLALLKSTFNAEHFICKLSCSISNGFDAIHSWNVYHSLK